MHTENSILIRASLEDVYDLAMSVEDWPRILPHYRYVRIHDTAGRCRVVEMAARRDAIPVWWMSVQECHPDVPEIAYHHVRGITKGMEVEWTFEPGANGVLVRIYHELRLDWPLIGGIVADWIIGPLFVESIARRTLVRIKALAEARHEERRRYALVRAGYRYERDPFDCSGE